MSRWLWRMRQTSRSLWVRTTLIGLMGVAAAILAAMVEHLIPWDMPAFVPVAAIESLLTIIASSMLAVSTFSLNIMTSAYGSASSNVTPRATRLLMEDTMTQTVLASFVGSFIFSIVGMVLLRFGVYGERGRVVLFVLTIWVLAIIVINLLRWINYLTRFGRMGETIGRVEAATKAAMVQRLEEPMLGGTYWAQPCQVPHGAHMIDAQQVGFLQHIDMPALSALAQELDAQVYLATLPGKSLYVDSPLAWVVCSSTAKQEGADAGGDAAAAPTGEALAAALDKMRASFAVTVERNFDQDPRFGLAVLCEIASRALSPATNDPGTALDVIARCTRLLSAWAQKAQRVAQDMPPVQYPRVHVAPLSSEDLFDDAFMLMARDGAHLIEVQLHLHKSLAALARLGVPEFRQAAKAQADLALQRAQQALPLQADKERLRKLVVQMGISAWPAEQVG